METMEGEHTETASARVPFATVLGVEHRRTERLPGDGERRQYGQTAITFYRRD